MALGEHVRGEIINTHLVVQTAAHSTESEKWGPKFEKCTVWKVSAVHIRGTALLSHLGRGNGSVVMYRSSQIRSCSPTVNVLPYHVSQDVPVDVEQRGTMDCGIGHGRNNISKACHCTCPSWTSALEAWYPLLKELVLLSKDKKTAVLSRKYVHCMVGQLTNNNG